LIILFVDKEKDIENLNHIHNVLEERTLWYKKRQLETKRAMKSLHRLNTLPKPTVTQTMLEAEINYTINKAGVKTLTIIINQFDALNTSIIKSHLQREFIKQLQEADKLFAKEYLSEIQYLELFEVVFSLNEDYQRSTIANFILNYIERLINKIFKDITILDDFFTKEVVKDLKEYLQSNVCNKKS
jgi:hypothetical protein